MMRKIPSILLLFMTPIILCGCSRIITCKADELVMNTWYFENKNGVYAQLSFNDNIASLQITSVNEESVLISGQVLVNESEIVITDTETKQSFVMTYELYGDKIILKYDTYQLIMTKNAAADNIDEQE